MATASKAKKKTVRLASGRKRARQDVNLNAANTSLRSKFRTVVKNVQKAVATGDKTKAADLFKTAQAVIDSVADKGIFHKNKAARHKSRLSAKIKALSVALVIDGPAAACLLSLMGLLPQAFRHLGLGSRQASTTCNSLSLAKFIAKSQAIGSSSRSASLTITHFTLSITRGMQ